MNKDESRSKQPEVYDSVVEGLRNVYKSKILPLEQNYLFHDFHSPALDDPDFDARPMILLVGQYSTGKTTFIRYLLEKVSKKLSQICVNIVTNSCLVDSGLPWNSDRS